MKMQLSDLGNRWFGENFIIPQLMATWVEHDIHNCCQNQLVAVCYREHMRSSNWNGLWGGADERIQSDQISSILLAVCKQLLINNTVTIWRQMTLRLQKRSHTSCLREGKLPGVSAHTCDFLLSDSNSTLNRQTPFHQRLDKTPFQLGGRCSCFFSSRKTYVFNNPAVVL